MMASSVVELMMVRSPSDSGIFWSTNLSCAADAMPAIVFIT